MRVRLPLLCVVSLLMLAGCSYDSPIQAEEANAALSGEGGHRSMVNTLDGVVQNAVELVAGDDINEREHLLREDIPGWGKDADAFHGHDIALTPLGHAEGSPQRREMGCNFVPAHEKQAVLAARTSSASDAFAMAVIANGGVRQRLVSTTTGGFGALASGMEMQGTGVSATISLKSRDTLTPLGTGSTYPASLTIMTGDGRQRIYSGLWICGL